MTGTRRAAIALMSLDRVTATKLLSALPKECGAGVTAEMHQLGRVSREEMQAAEKQFLQEVGALLCGWTKS